MSRAAEHMLSRSSYQEEKEEKAQKEEGCD